MTRKLEEEFGLPHLDEMEIIDTDNTVEEFLPTTKDVEQAIDISDKINNALAEVRGMEVHDSEMDEIASEAMESYKQLMSLGMNMTDMAAGPVFGNAQQMLKVALDAKDSKVNRKLKQIDLMLKKANLDARLAKEAKANGEIEEEVTNKTFDRNELLKILNQKN